MSKEAFRSWLTEENQEHGSGLDAAREGDLLDNLSTLDDRHQHYLTYHRSEIFKKKAEPKKKNLRKIN